jgi:hypothetical protein
VAKYEALSRRVKALTPKAQIRYVIHQGETLEPLENEPWEQFRQRFLAWSKEQDKTEPGVYKVMVRAQEEHICSQE